MRIVVDRVPKRRPMSLTKPEPFAIGKNHPDERSGYVIGTCRFTPVADATSTRDLERARGRTGVHFRFRERDNQPE